MEAESSVKIKHRTTFTADPWTIMCSSIPEHKVCPKNNYQEAGREYHNNLRGGFVVVLCDAWRRRFLLRKTKTRSPKARACNDAARILGGKSMVHRGAISCSNNLRDYAPVVVHRWFGRGAKVWRERSNEEVGRRLLSYVSRCTGLFA